MAMKILFLEWHKENHQNEYDNQLRLTLEASK